MFIVIFGLSDYLATWLISSYKGFRGFLIIRLLQVFRVSQALLAMPVLHSIRYISADVSQALLAMPVLTSQ